MPSNGTLLKWQVEFQRKWKHDPAINWLMHEAENNILYLKAWLEMHQTTSQLP